MFNVRLCYCNKTYINLKALNASLPWGPINVARNVCQNGTLQTKSGPDSPMEPVRKITECSLYCQQSWLQNHNAGKCSHFFFLFRVYCGNPCLLFSSQKSYSDRMWNVAGRLEDSPWSGGKRRAEGWIPKCGLQWEGRGYVPVCLRYGMADCEGSSGVIHSHITFAAVGAGLTWGEQEEERQISHDVHSLSLLDLELNSYSEVDNNECGWVTALFQ